MRKRMVWVFAVTVAGCASLDRALDGDGDAAPDGAAGSADGAAGGSGEREDAAVVCAAGAQDAPPCSRLEGVCAGSRRPCVGGFWQACDIGVYTAHSPAYVADETDAHCDGLDNDCDGDLDEACPCADGETLACGEESGACRAGVRRCEGARWGDCEGAAGPQAEACNGIDDDCDGRVDDDLERRPCGLQAGVCAGAASTCVNGEWQACDAAAYSAKDPRYVADEAPPACDGVDNDCDGTVDEGCACSPGATRPCGSDVGACTPGTETCEGGGAWSACTGRGPQPEVCNGADDDCDGRVDGVCDCSIGVVIQVDNDIANSGYREDPAANWASRPTGACHGTYRYLSTTVGDASRRGRAIWEPEVPADGWYRIVTSYRATGNRTPDADYFVHDDRGGVTHRVANQRVEGGDCTRFDLGEHFCRAGGTCRVVLDGTDDGESDAADITTFTLARCGDEPPPPPQGCQGIANHPGYELCGGGADRCVGVFTDGSGCVAFCAAAGMVCVDRLGGEPGCVREDYHIGCDENNGHQSDWCECERR